MIQFPQARVLMQADQRDDKISPNVMIGVGGLFCMMTALLILACSCRRRVNRKLEEQNRKYKNWTASDGSWSEFSELAVKPQNRNPLHIAIIVNNFPLVKKLVGEGYQKCDYVDQNGLYALHFAAASRSKELLSYIAEHTPKEFRPEGHSPLHVAASNDGPSAGIQGRFL